MARVLVEGSKVTCGAADPHQGVLAMTGAATLQVDGRAVLTEQGVKGAKVSTTEPCQNPDSAGGPCSGVLTISTGTATRLQVDGVPVILASLAATTDRSSPVKVDEKAIHNDLLEAD